MFGNDIRLGIWLDDTGAEAGVLRRWRKGWKALASARAGLQGPLMDADATDLEPVFKTLRQKLPASVCRADTVVALAVPEHLVMEEVMSFEAFPAAAAEAQALVRQRAARETGLDPATLAISHEVVAREPAVRCRVRIMDKALRDRIEAAARRAGFRITRLDGWLGFAAAGVETSAPVALWADAAGWALACQSGTHPEGFCDAGRLDEPDARARIARIIRSYVHREALSQATVVVDADVGLFEDLKGRLAAGEIDCRPMPQPTFAQGRADRVAAWA